MSLTEASALLAKQAERGNRHDSLRFEEHDPAADQSALESLADYCQRYSPVVGLEAACPASALLLDVGGSAPRLGGERELVERVCCELSVRQLVVRTAIADTVGAAWGLAHFGELNSLRHPNDNSVSADQQPHVPNRSRVHAGEYLIVPRGAAATENALAPLPIEALRLDDDTTDVLHALGVRVIHQLLQLPRDGLATRFGDHLLQRIDQALGRTPEPIVIYQSPPPLTIEHVLEHPTARLDSLETLIRQLLERLEQRLRVQQRGVLQLECLLATTQPHNTASHRAHNRSPWVMQIGLFHPTAVASHLFELLQMQLENHRLLAPVHCVSLHAHVTAPLEQQQSALLEDIAYVAPGQLTHLVNRLSSRMGHHAVASARLMAEALPEEAFRYVALTGARLSKARASRRKSPGLRPLRLQPQIMALRATAVIPDGPPISFEYCGQAHRIAHCWGPERIETGWWKGPTIRRDYFRVEDQRGRRFWIFRDLRNGDWFLHGVFG